MRSVPVRLAAIALLLLPQAALADEPIATTRDIWAPADSCDYYEHSEFGGEVGNIAWGDSYIYVGSRWNDRISSIACAYACALYVWEHRDFQGASEVFFGDFVFVGERWNDRISSMEVVCD